ncbi:MAG: DUF4915 domain-containing protein [Cyanobacteria bacterium SZAS-4]|nr:DUF4915 domain-containing protein [Cyanobacteria bacterium SZAS-4]
MSNTLLVPLQTTEEFTLEDDLLVSAVWKPPYMGGLFSISKGSPTSIRVVDRLSGTGLWRDYDMLVRSIYHSSYMLLHFYGADGTACIVNQSYKQVHDVRFQFGQLYVVSTGTNEVVQLDQGGNLAYQWKFPGEQGSWHLNCIDLWNGRYVVSCFGRKEKPSDYAGSWQEHGVIFDLESGDVLWDGLTKPHTPRMDVDGRQYVCDSETNRLLIRQADGSITEILFPGAFTRGIAFGKNYIYVGLSAIRHRGDEKIGPNSIPNARIAILDRTSFKQLGQINLPSAEVYDIVITS